MSYEVADFKQEVIERSHTVPVLVDFWATWCAPCKILGPALEHLEVEANGGWVLAKVDTDKNQDLAADYGIKGIPAVKLFVDGKVAAEFTGALPEPMVAQWLRKVLPDPHRRDIELAQELLDDGNTPQAVEVLDRILARDPGNHQARVLLAEVVLSTDRARALDLVRPVEEDSEFFPGASAIRTVAGLEEKLENPSSLPDDPVKPLYLDAIRELQCNNFEHALDRFIEVIRINRYYDDDGARKACIAIFTLLGEEHETTRSKRREFASALYV